MLVKEEVLNKALEIIISKKNVYSAVLCCESGNKDFSWIGASGEMRKDSQYFITSVTKLFITCIVMLLIDEGKLCLDDKIVKYLPIEFVRDLHVKRNVEYSEKITIKHLISNTSGLPDYFFSKQSSGKTAASDLLKGIDEAYPLEKTLEVVKKCTPKFIPGKKGRAAYSDTNYQLLGKIIEIITGKPIRIVFQEYIFDKLKLKQTYAYDDINDDNPVDFYYKSRKIWVPNYMASIKTEGGIVSTAEETMVFLKAFFNDYFFPKTNIEKLKVWNIILPPPTFIYYGIGLEKLWTPKIISLSKPITEILGFWGQSGSFAWYNPDTDLYFTGTTNQANGTGHAAVFKAILKIIKSAL